MHFMSKGADMSEVADLLNTGRARPTINSSVSPLDSSYGVWVKNPTPDNMKALLDELDPTINAEIQRFSGPKPLLRSRARALAVKAIRTYDPASTARLRSWVVTQLQPLSRYTNTLKPIYAPEDAARKSYAVSKARTAFSDEYGRDPTDEELSDSIGISVKRLKKIVKMTPAVTNEPKVTDADDGTSAELGIYRTNTVPEAASIVYSTLDKRDKRIFDMRTGAHGTKSVSGNDIASLLKVSPAFVTQRSNNIASRIQELAGRL